MADFYLTIHVSQSNIPCEHYFLNLDIMTTLNLDKNDAQYQIRSYQPGFLKINDQIYTQSVIVAPNTLITNWPPQTLDELAPEAFIPILELKPAILLIGTGEKHEFIAPQIYGVVINAGIGVEIMSTSAASRTYNVLSSENREVVAALLVR